jgi:uncharacterized protein YbdZ (MbtH family)
MNTAETGRKKMYKLSGYTFYIIIQTQQKHLFWEHYSTITPDGWKPSTLSTSDYQVINMDFSPYSEYGGLIILPFFAT